MGLADFTFKVVEIFRGIRPDFRCAAFFIATGAGAAQQGPKLVGTGAVGSAFQGVSVSLSGDGNTVIVGGYGDNSNTGAAWVFTQSGGVWTQQGNKLVGTGVVGSVALQGASVGLSADGNTAIVGGYIDNSGTGAAWAYNRSNGIWTQQGTKLVGTGAVGIAGQGYSVALSADGNTAIVGGYGSDNSNTGRRGSLSNRGCRSPPPPTWSRQAIPADPLPPHHSNTNSVRWSAPSTIRFRASQTGSLPLRPRARRRPEPP
jgi:hypothetical protein